MKHPVILFIAVLLSAWQASAQKPITEIKLRDVPMVYKPKLFHITDVVDDRANTDVMGTMRTGVFNATHPITLESGLAPALLDYIAINVKQNQETMPVALHITQMEVQESDRVMSEIAQVAIGIAFYRDGRLVGHYELTATAESQYDVSRYIETAIRQSIANGFKHLDKLLERRKKNGENVGVDARVRLVNGSKSPDVLAFFRYYPVEFSDFKGKPGELDSGMAKTHTEIHMNYVIDKRDEFVAISIELSPLFYAAKSWVKKEAKNGKVLTHEQRHFEITAVTTCELADSISKFNFTAANYEQELKNIKEYFVKVLEDRQRQYDEETMYGQKARMQIQWNRRLGNQLDNKRCF